MARCELKQGEKSLIQTLAPEREGEAHKKARARMGVEGKIVEQAAKVMEKAAPEIVEKIKLGEMAVGEATGAHKELGRLRRLGRNAP